MADEIIALERSGTTQQFAFLYTVPPAKRIEIGGVGTTGQYPVLSPTSGMDETLLLVLSTAEKDALDAGEALLMRRSLDMGEGASDADVLAAAQDFYAHTAPIALAEYETRFRYIGRRFDAS